MPEFNCFGRHGCTVKNPGATIEFLGETYGDLSLKDAITPERLYVGVLVMNSVAPARAPGFVEKHGNDKITITNMESGKSSAITLRDLMMCESGMGCDGWLKMVGDLR